MKNSKLVELMCVFTPAEMLELRKYAIDFYKLKESPSLKLFFLLEKALPNLDQNDISKKSIFKKIFKQEDFNENKLSKLMSELIKLIEQFVIDVLSPKDFLIEKLYLMRFYYEKNLLKNFETHKRQFQDLLSQSLEGAKKNYFLYQFEELVISGELKINNRLADYSKVYKQLNEFYFAEKYRWENLALINLHPQMELTEPNGLYYSTHLILNKLLKENKEEDFLLLFNKMDTFKGKFIAEELVEIFNILLNFTIQKIAIGEIDYYEKCASIFEVMIASEVLVCDDGFIKMGAYKNYITVLIRLNKIDRAIEFLEEFKQYLAPEIREDTYFFNKALLLFEQNDYNMVLEILNKIKVDDIFYKINQKRLMIKTFYELQKVNDTYFDILNNQLNAFKKYIYTEKSLPEINIEVHKNFVKILMKILGISKGENARILLLENEIKKLKRIAEKDWILLKLAELKK